MPLLPVWAFMACSQVKFTFTFYSNLTEVTSGRVWRGRVSVACFAQSVRHRHRYMSEVRCIAVAAVRRRQHLVSLHPTSLSLSTEARRVSN